MIRDRIRQFRDAGAQPCEADFELARTWLAAPLFELFRRQHPRDVVHSANTARWLMARGISDREVLGAALLHDIGKGPQRPIDRAIHVLAGYAGLAHALGASSSRFELRRAVARTLSHSASGAAMLREAGAADRIVELTARHHDPAGDDGVLALLQQADAAS